MIRMIVFDLDDTLFDKAAAHRRYVEDFMERHSQAFPQGRRAEALEELAPSWFRGGDRFGFARKVLGTYPAVGRSDAEIAEDYAARIARFIPPDPEIIRLISDLSRRFTIAVLTNGSARVQRAKLARMKLGDLIARVYISGETRLKKPEAGAYLRPLQEAGCRPDEAIMVGDRTIEDMRGAFDVGMGRCWVSWGRIWHLRLFGSPAPDRTIHRVVDLPGVLP